MKPITIKEKAVFDYICEFYAETGYAPTVRDIKGALNISSTSVVHYYLSRLVEKGYLIKDANKSRSLRPSDAVPTYRVPVIGKVTAGSPILAFEEDLGTVTFSSDGRRYDQSNLFALKVRGESMIGAGILSGDVVIVEKCQTCRDGEIVVALLEDEATVKTLYHEGGKIRLQPENPEYEPIYTDSVAILGKVIASVRYY